MSLDRPSFLSSPRSFEIAFPYAQILPPQYSGDSQYFQVLKGTSLRPPSAALRSRLIRRPRPRTGRRTSRISMHRGVTSTSAVSFSPYLHTCLAAMQQRRQIAAMATASSTCTGRTGCTRERMSLRRAMCETRKRLSSRLFSLHSPSPPSVIPGHVARRRGGAATPVRSP